MTVTVSHRDTCLACYLTDHHNRAGECLVGVPVYRSSRVHEVRTALYDEAASLLGHRDDAPDMAAISAAINEAFKGAHPLKCFDRDLDAADRADEPCQAWFLITWPAAEAETDEVTDAEAGRRAREAGWHYCAKSDAWTHDSFEDYAGSPQEACEMSGISLSPMVAQPSQPQQAQARPSVSADASPRQRIAFGPARLHPAAEGAIMTGTPDAPDGAELIGYNAPAGRFYAAAYRLGNGCVLVDVCAPRGPYDARLRRVFVNLECAELYAGRLARLARYRRERAHHMLALGHIRAAQRTHGWQGIDAIRRVAEQRTAAATRARFADVVEAFGLGAPSVIDAPAPVAVPTDLALLADWLA